MSTFDIKQMAKELVARNTHLSAREVIVTRFIETAVEMINEPWNSEKLLSNITSVYELDYDLISVDTQVLDLVEQIVSSNRRNRWDPRIKIKLESKKVGATYHRIHVVMDLDKTLGEALELDSAYRKSLEVKEDIKDSVTDNPNPDLINELDRVLLSELTPRPKVLSDRLGVFVREDTDGNQRVCNWEATQL